MEPSSFFIFDLVILLELPVLVGENRLSKILFLWLKTRLPDFSPVLTRKGDLRRDGGVSFFTDENRFNLESFVDGVACRRRRNPLPSIGGVVSMAELSLQ